MKDRDYLQRMPERRDDGSIFLSLASYRDENCLNTIRWAYEKAKNPENLYVGREYPVFGTLCSMHLV